jgi:hypothetical protein
MAHTGIVTSAVAGAFCLCGLIGIALICLTAVLVFLMGPILAGLDEQLHGPRVEKKSVGPKQGLLILLGALLFCGFLVFVGMALGDGW